MDQIRRVIGAMLNWEEGLLNKRILKVQRKNNATTFTIIVSTLLNLLLLAIGYFAITKHLRERREYEARINQLNQRLHDRAEKTACVNGNAGRPAS